jgi:hypothetical protein
MEEQPTLHARLNRHFRRKKRLNVCSRRSTKSRSICLSMEEIEAMSNLAEVIAGDPFRSKQEIQRRVKDLRLRPIITTDGLSFEATGDVRLFDPEECWELLRPKVPSISPPGICLFAWSSIKSLIGREVVQQNVQRNQRELSRSQVDSLGSTPSCNCKMSAS